jgi:TonB-dependent receptor
VGAPTDIDGKFSIPNVKPGTYNLSVTFVTYKAHLIPDVVVESGKISEIQVQMQEDVSELKEVVITGTREINNDMALITAIKESKLVVSGISAEQITRLPDKDAAQVMMRVPGVTIVDSRFVMIRGVSERYNQVMINNAIAPSTEIDRRSFSFDLIPSGTLDQLLIYKSGTPELPGDFAGGVIQVNTKNAGEDNFVSVSVNTGYRNNTTFKNYVQSEGSNTDKFGFDDGFRSLPQYFPSTNSLKSSTRTSQTRQGAGRSLSNNFGNTTKETPLDMGFNIGFGRRFNIGKIEASNLTTFGYSNSYQNKTVTFNRYLSYTPGQETPNRFEYNDNYYNNDVRISVIHNWQFLIGDRHKIEFKNLFNQLGEHQTILRTGRDSLQGPQYDRQNYAYHYLSRSIYSGQLQGSHASVDERNQYTWVVGVNYLNRNEPDYRRFRTYRDKIYRGTEEAFTMQLPPSANLFETGRFYSKLEDVGYSHGLNFERKFGAKDEKRTPTLKAGYYGEYKTRTFDARYLSYLYPGTFDQSVGQSLIQQSIDQIFAPKNIKTQDGFVIEEGTRPTDHYTGTNLLVAGYVGGSVPIKKFDISGGIRVESNTQQLESKTDTDDINVDNPIISTLPFLNVAYNLSERSLLRLAYSRTVNRPEFRELAPFLYYNFEMELGVTGNKNLKTADIDNVDLRWEMYPNPNEMVSIGTFYKRFRNPIETYLQITTESPQQTYGNAPEAFNWGVELELRKSLASLVASEFFRNLYVNLNASYIKSEVDLGAQAISQTRIRPLQGQSPYIINSGLYYSDDERGFSVNTAYNIFGERIFAVGDNNFPTIYELPRHSWDFSISKKLKQKFEIKFNVQNLLNSKFRFYQDSDENGEVSANSVDDPILVYRTGTQFTLGLTWKVSK